MTWDGQTHLQADFYIDCPLPLLVDFSWRTSNLSRKVHQNFLKYYFIILRLYLLGRRFVLLSILLIRLRKVFKFVLSFVTASKRQKEWAILLILLGTVLFLLPWKWRGKGTSIVSSTSFSPENGTCWPLFTSTIGGPSRKSSVSLTDNSHPQRKWHGWFPLTM